MAAQPYQLTGYESDLSDAEWELTQTLLYPADARRDLAECVMLTPQELVWTPSAMFSKQATSGRCSPTTRASQHSPWPLDRARLVAQAQRSPAHQDTPGARETPCSAPLSSTTWIVKGGQLPAVNCGYDAVKKIEARKRHALTDTNGLPLGAAVKPANVQDRDGAKLLLRIFCHSLLGLMIIFFDCGYAGKLETIA